MSAAKKSTVSASMKKMQQAQLDHWAARIATAPDGMSDYERLQVADYLRRIARNPAAIEAMLTIPKGRGRPSSVESRARADRMALDYLLTKARIKIEKSGKAHDALREVSKAWSVGRTAVLDAYKDPRWKPWSDYERKRFELDHADLTGSELLLAHSEELRESA